MNNRALTLSLLMAVVAVFFVQSYVSSIEDDAKRKFGTEMMAVTAKRDIKEMETLEETMFELKAVPKTFLEPVAISYPVEGEEGRKNAIQDMKKLTGSVALVPIKLGEQITYNKITEPSLRTGLSPQVTPGRRAVAIPVTETSGVAKLVKPGDRVDVIAVLDFGTGRDNKVARTLLQDVAVLAVGRLISNNVPRQVETDPSTGKSRVRALTQFDGFASVTLEVEPYQAQQLALVMAGGSNQITLSLRNNDDSDRPVSVGVTGVDLLGSDAARFRRPATGGGQ